MDLSNPWIFVAVCIVYLLIGIFSGGLILDDSYSDDAHMALFFLWPLFLAVYLLYRISVTPYILGRKIHNWIKEKHNGD